MHFIKGAVAAVTLGSTLLGSNAQVTTACNPLNVVCPNDKGLPTSSYTIDFTSIKELPSEWALADQTEVTLGASGAELTFNKRFDAPTMRTNFHLFFGRVEFVVKAAPGTGIISSMVLLSDDLDEIDWEFRGGITDSVQTNYFGKGITGDYNRSTTNAVATPQETFHTYVVDWSQEALVWSIDGNVIRTLKAADADGNGDQYPQTPMRVSLSLWDAGDPDTNPGTVAWAGGYTPIPPPQPYTMYVKSVKIWNNNPAQEYQYTDMSGSWKSIKVINETMASDSSSAMQSTQTSSLAPMSQTKTQYTGVAASNGASFPSASHSVSPSVPAGSTSTVTEAASTLASLPLSSKSYDSTVTVTNAVTTTVTSSSPSKTMDPIISLAALTTDVTVNPTSLPTQPFNSESCTTGSTETPVKQTAAEPPIISSPATSPATEKSAIPSGSLTSTPVPISPAASSTYMGSNPSGTSSSIPAPVFSAAPSTYMGSNPSGTTTSIPAPVSSAAPSTYIGSKPMSSSSLESSPAPVSSAARSAYIGSKPMSSSPLDSPSPPPAAFTPVISVANLHKLITPSQSSGSMSQTPAALSMPTSSTCGCSTPSPAPSAAAGTGTMPSAAASTFAISVANLHKLIVPSQDSASMAQTPAALSMPASSTCGCNTLAATATAATGTMPYTYQSSTAAATPNTTLKTKDKDNDTDAYPEDGMFPAPEDTPLEDDNVVNIGEEEDMPFENKHNPSSSVNITTTVSSTRTRTATMTSTLSSSEGTGTGTGIPYPMSNGTYGASSSGTVGTATGTATGTGTGMMRGTGSPAPFKGAGNKMKVGWGGAVVAVCGVVVVVGGGIVL